MQRPILQKEVYFKVTQAHKIKMFKCIKDLILDDPCPSYFQGLIKDPDFGQTSKGLTELSTFVLRIPQGDISSNPTLTKSCTCRLYHTA